MRKNLFLRLFLLIALSTLLYSCRTEEELNPKNGEAGNLRYGISKEVFMGSLFVTGLKSNSSKNVASALTAEELVERLDLEKAHLNSNNGKEVFHVPVRTFGSYKRSLLSISGNGNSMAVLLTYPNPEDQRLFYITDLNGNLLKEVKIGDDGKELPASPTSKKSSIAGKSDDLCEEVVYETCSSGQHSFETGNAYQCEFWHNLQGGTPPKLFKINGICGGTGSGGGGTPIGGDGSSGGHPAGGSSTSPVGGGGPPKYDFTSADCVQNLDCENCNIPGDTNNDCKLSYDEAIAFNDNPCAKIGIRFNETKFKEKIAAIDKPEVFNYDHEMGYAAGYPPPNTGITETQYPPMENTLGTHNVTLPPGNQYFGFIHTHNNESNGGYPVKIFSPGDLATFLTSCVANADAHGNITDAYAMVITSEGNYMLQFTGQSSGFGIGPNTKKFWLSWYEREIGNLILENEMTQPNIEKVFLRFLKEKIKIDGVELYQVEKITGKAKKLSLDQNNNVIPIPCP